MELKKTAYQNNFLAFNLGLGEKKGLVKIYDYKDNDGSSHASLYSKVITEIHKSKAIEHDVKITTIDAFIKENKIDKINLLKIDTEGNELNVLKGAQRTLENNLIDVIHFEFNEMNVISKTFFKDFYNILRDFTFYRMLPDGIISLGEYNPLLCEIFAYQNIVAIRNGINIKL